MNTPSMLAPGPIGDGPTGDAPLVETSPLPFVSHPADTPAAPDHSAAIRPWLHLALSVGVGPVTVRKLLERFETPVRILGARTHELLDYMTPGQLRALLEPDEVRETAISHALRWATAPGCHLLSLADPRYPALLGQIPDPPPVLFVEGHPEVLNRPAVAIVGSRNASRDGLALARSVASALSRAGLTVVSGLAAGIDGAAHQGALDVGSATVALIGTGPDRVYPPQHRPLAHAVLADGAIATELPLGAGALAHHFPRRNRLIAGISHGVVVIQAARQSGSLITARMAAEFGRDVMVFPGSIHSPLSKGCHQLIREGAALVEDATDIAELLSRPLALALSAHKAHANPAGRTSEDPGPGPLSEQARALLDAIDWSPAKPDELAGRCKMSASHTAATLIELELAGHLERLIDGRFQRLGKPVQSPV